MPVDYLICVLPLLVVAAAIPAAVGGRYRTVWRWITGGLVALFLLIYFVPGWILYFQAQRGDREAQAELGNYYWTRLGYNWPDIDARDRWWVEAANQGHPGAMYRVGYFSMFGTSRHIPKDLVAAREWLEAAHAAGQHDAPSGLKVLTEAEREVNKRR